jgi:DeoR/GlpR family transcriptional regulator of sugar metabolism
MRAVDARHGFTNDYLPETMTDRAIRPSPAYRRVADHRKFGRASLVLVGPVTLADLVITDTDTSAECPAERSWASK